MAFVTLPSTTRGKAVGRTHVSKRTAAKTPPPPKSKRRGKEGPSIPSWGSDGPGSDAHLPPAPASLARRPRRWKPAAQGTITAPTGTPRAIAVPAAGRSEPLTPRPGGYSASRQRQLGHARPPPGQAEGRRPYLRGREPARWGKGAPRGACSYPHKRGRVRLPPAPPRPALPPARGLPQLASPTPPPIRRERKRP